MAKDERLQILGTALRGAKRLMDKASVLVQEMVHIVLQYGLCPTHKLRLKMFIRVCA